MGDDQPNNNRNSKRPYIFQDLEWLKSRKLAITVILILAIIFALPLYKWIKQPSRSPSNPFGKPSPEGVKVKVDLDQTADYGDDLSIKVLRINQKDPQKDPSDYRVDSLVIYKKAETVTFNNAKAGAIFTYPPENGYDIKVVKVEAQYVVFDIKAP